MTERILIMIADEDRVFTHHVCSALSGNQNVTVLPSYHTGIGLIDAIRQQKPDILLMDLMLPGVNGLAILQELTLLPTECRPSTFVVSQFASAETSAECERLGVSFFLRKPMEAVSLANMILRYGTAHTRAAVFPPVSEGPKETNLPFFVTRVLNNMHVPAHVMGYRYVRDGILMALEDPASADSVTKILYPAIAKKYNVTWTSVERDIRNAISLAWKRSGGRFPGFSALRHPTNREFILTIADHIQFELHSQSRSSGSF